MDVYIKLHDVNYTAGAPYPDWTLPDTTLSRKDDTTIVLDGQEIELGTEDGIYENISIETNGRIIEGRCESGITYLTIIAYYVGTQPEWADGKYHALEVTA